jgi:SAM-dependent methyltransferase/MFS family permease
MCYLAENSTNEKDRIFKSSFTFVGPQIGLLLSLGVVLFLQKYLSPKVLLQQGWRSAFLSTGLLGIGGYFLRKKLHETRGFNLAQKGHQILQYPVKELFKHHKQEIALACALSTFEIVAFCLITIVHVFYYKEIFNLTQNENLIISIITLVACTIFPPIIGRIAGFFPERFFPARIIQLMNLSAWGFIVLSPFFYYAILHKDLIYTLSIQTILVLLFSIQAAILPSLLTRLFPTPIRYTGIGFSFNICDGILWGLVPFISASLIYKTQNIASFVIFFPIAAVIFLISSSYLKRNSNAIEEKNANIVYFSGQEKSKSQANLYSKTHGSTHRYLAYRDIPSILENHFQSSLIGKTALDYGTGTGYSANFLRELGFKVIGVDISDKMLLEARTQYSDLSFDKIKEDGSIPLGSNTCDLIFSSFVLFEMGTKEEIIKYLSEAKRVMKNNGLFVAVTGSQDLHSPARKWVNFKTDFPENENLFSGKPVRLFLNSVNMEFNDYYWTEVDYYNLFLMAGFDIMEMRYPLANASDPYTWKDETIYSPFLILVAKVKPEKIS